MITAILALIAFLTTLVTAFGETQRKDQVGLKRVTRLGWISLGLAFIVLVLSGAQALRLIRQQHEIISDRAIAKRAAHAEIAIALRELSHAMPRFRYLPPLFSRPITEDDIRKGELPLIDQPPTNEERESARLRWIQRSKVSAFNEPVLKAIVRLRSATNMFSSYISGKTLAGINELLSDSSLEIYAPERADRTLEEAMYSENEVRAFQKTSASLICTINIDPELFEFGVREISNELYEREIRPRLTPSAKSLSMIDYLSNHKLERALIENGRVRELCSSAVCAAKLKQLTELPACISAQLTEG